MDDAVDTTVAAAVVGSFAACGGLRGRFATGTVEAAFFAVFLIADAVAGFLRAGGRFEEAILRVGNRVLCQLLRLSYYTQ